MRNFQGTTLKTGPEVDERLNSTRQTTKHPAPSDGNAHLRNILALKPPPSSDQACSLDQRASLQTPWNRDRVMWELSHDTTGMPTTKCKRWQILQNEKNTLRFLQQIHCKGIQTCQSKCPVWDFTSGNLMSRCPRTRRGTI